MTGLVTRTCRWPATRWFELLNSEIPGMMSMALLIGLKCEVSYNDLDIIFTTIGDPMATAQFWAQYEGIIAERTGAQA